MVRKGNLLYNGDFESGDVEGWTVAPKCSLYSEANIAIDNANQKSGSYCGKLTAGGASYQAKGYDLKLDFEEYVGYLFEIWGKKDTAYGLAPMVEFYDSQGNIRNCYMLNYTTDTGYILSHGIFTNWGMGAYAKLFLGIYALNAGEIAYFDNVSVIGLKNIKDWSFNLFKDLGTITSDTTWNTCLMIPRPAIIRDKVNVTNTGGTSPTLDIEIRMNAPYILSFIEGKSFSQITGDGLYFLTFETNSFGLIYVKHTLGGTDPTFDVSHHMEVILQ